MCRLTVDLLRRNASASSTKSRSLWRDKKQQPSSVDILSGVAVFIFATFNVITSGLPASTCVRPVKHFVHGCHTITAHGCHITTSHNCIVHPRMRCQLLLNTKRSASQLDKASLSMYVYTRHHAVIGSTLAKRVLPVPGGPYMRMFLYRPLFCLVFLVAMAMSRTRSSRDGWEIGKKMHFY